MSQNIANFLGTWYVKWVSGRRMDQGETPYIDVGYTVLIGTGTQGDSPPWLTGTYDVAVGFALLNAAGEVVIPPPEGSHQPAVCLLLDGTLRWLGFWEGQPVRLYLSLGETISPSNVRTYSIYASTTYGDPDQVGVWGADGNPPHGG